MLEQWNESARRNQQDFAVSLGDRVWDKFIMPTDKKELWIKIAYAVAGDPPSENYDYKAEQKKRIDELKEKCLEYCKKQGSGDVVIAIIFVCAIDQSESMVTTVPVIRVKKGDGRNPKLSYFIDHTGRVYETWQNYLNENIFDGWWICVPEDGQYSFTDKGDVRLKFYNQTERGQVLKSIDKLSTVSTIASSITMIGGFLLMLNPITLPVGAAVVTGSAIAGAPGAAYGAGRSIGTLVDRSLHDQSINPFESAEARSCWLTTAASVFSVATMGSAKILTSTAKAGNLVGSGTRALCTTLNITALSVNGLGVVNAVYEVSKKDTVTSLDVLQLGTSIFFFTHSFVNFKTASTIIKDAQHEVIAAAGKEIAPENKAAFDQMHQAKKEMVEPGKVRTMHGNNEFIRELKRIDNKQEFFSAFQLVGDNQLSVNQELVIDAKAFLQMTETERKTVLKFSDDLRNERITEIQFDKEVSAIRKEYRITFEKQRAHALDTLKKTFGVLTLADVEVAGNKIFKNIKPHEIDRLNQVLKEAGKNYNPDCVNVALEMAKHCECSNVTEFTAAAEYAIRQVDAMIVDSKQKNPNPSLPSGMKKKNFYIQEASKKFLSNPDKFVKDFQSLRGRCDAANHGFANSMAAANHYDKHPDFPKVDPHNNLSPDRYFEIAKEMCSGPMKNPKWTQDGASLTCTFTSDKYGALAIRYDNLANGTSVIVTLMQDKKPIGPPRMYG